MNLKVIANNVLFIVLYSTVVVSIFSNERTMLTVKYFAKKQYYRVLANVTKIEYIGLGSSSLGSMLYVEFNSNEGKVSTSFEQLGYLIDKKIHQKEIFVCKSDRKFVTSMSNLIIELIIFMIAMLVLVLLIIKIVKLILPYWNNYRQKSIKV
jgi:hypothetical protein